MASHSSILDWKVLWTEEPGRLLSKGWQRAGHDWATKHTQKLQPNHLNSLSLSSSSLKWGKDLSNPIPRVVVSKHVEGICNHEAQCIHMLLSLLSFDMWENELFRKSIFPKDTQLVSNRGESKCWVSKYLNWILFHWLSLKCFVSSWRSWVFHSVWHGFTEW